MRFFEAQRLAKRNTFWLLVLFSMNVLVISGLNSLIALVLLAPSLILPVFIISFVILTGTAIYLVGHYSGGAKIAESLGGKKLSGNNLTFEEKRLQNIIEEMAIASGIQAPIVYVLSKEPMINAFAAGVNVNDTVIAVTEGALKKLNREELQAVIGHEFSHLLHEDLLLNGRLTGVVVGFQIFVKLGLEILNKLKLDKASLVFLFIGGALIAFGSLGYFLGYFIQSFISKEREYLADASSAQFTRNPEALARALAKIAAGGGSILTHPDKHELAHIFFADSVFRDSFKIFSTHPPIFERIKRLAPGIPIEDMISQVLRDQPGLTKSEALNIDLKNYQTLSLSERIRSVGNPDYHSLQMSNSLLNQLDSWNEALHDLDQARTALALVIFHSQENYQDSLLHIKAQAKSAQAFENLKNLVGQNDKIRTTVFQLALATLRNLSLKEKQEMLATISATFNQDQKISFLEGLLFAYADQILLPGLQKRAVESTAEQAYQDLDSWVRNPQTVDLKRLRNHLIFFRNLPLNERKQLLEKLGSSSLLPGREEFRLLGMALLIPVPLH